MAISERTVSKTLQDEKTLWRRHIRDIFKLTPPASRQPLDQALMRRLDDALAGHAQQLILAFSPLPDEPDIFPAFGKWLRAGGGLAFPVWSGTRDLCFRKISDCDRDLRPGRGGIREPASGLPEVEPGEAALALVPGRAFSEGRLRLGRGAGCYDLLFFRRKLITIGICYDFQVFPYLPGDEHDLVVDRVLTPGRTL